MKKEWQTKKLGDICAFEGGSQPPKSEFIHVEKPGYVRFLQIRDFGSDKNITYIPNSKKNRLCKENDILIGRYGASVGKILTDKAGAYNVALMKTIPNLEILDQLWFYNYLISNEFQSHLLKVADRSAQAGFSKDDICNFPVPVPPLSEQHRIVGILDEAFEGIATAKANAEKNLQNARALFESHLNSIFTHRGKGWVEKRLGEVTESISTGPFGTMLHKSDYVQGGIPLVNPMNIVNSGIVPSSKMMVNETTRERLRNYVLKAGDVVIARRGELGRCALITEREKGWICGTGSFFVRLSNCMDGNFFVALFGSQQFRARLEGSAVGTTMSSLNHGILNDLLLPVPPIAAQRKAMAKAEKLLAETQRLESINQQKLGALEAFKKSLLHQAFTGQL